MLGRVSVLLLCVACLSLHGRFAWSKAKAPFATSWTCTPETDFLHRHFTLHKSNITFTYRKSKEHFKIAKRIVVSTKGRKEGLILLLAPKGQKVEKTTRLHELHLYDLGKGKVGMVSPMGLHYGWVNPRVDRLTLAKQTHPHWRRWSRSCYTPAGLRARKHLQKTLTPTLKAALQARWKGAHKKHCRFDSKHDRRLCMREACIRLCMWAVHRRIGSWLERKGIHPIKGLQAFYKRPKNPPKRPTQAASPTTQRATIKHAQPKH